MARDRCASALVVGVVEPVTCSRRFKRVQAWTGVDKGEILVASGAKS